MTDLELRASQLETEIKNASPKERIALQPQVDRVISRLKAKGEIVPCRLQRMNETLRDEAIEDMFDNMPV